MIKSSTLWKIIVAVAVLMFVMCFVIPSVAYTSDSYIGEFIVANKVYMNDGSLNLVIYFNESSNTHYLIFEDWDARHSVILSNLDAGENIKIVYKDYTFGCRTIVDIVVL